MKTLFKIAAIAALMISFTSSASPDVESNSNSNSDSFSGAEAGAANGTNYQGNTTINQSSKGVKQHKWVPDASAPGLTTTLTETCMGSTTGGFSISGLGLSGGTTWTDAACIRRLDARELGAQGAKAASLERMCEDPKNRAAILRANKRYNNVFLCYADTPEGIAEAKAETVKVAAKGNKSTGVGYRASEINDPYNWTNSDD